MQVWAILIDCAKDDYQHEMIFDDRLFFAGLNKETVIEQLKAVVKNQDKVFAQMLELDYDDVKFYRPDNKWCPADCVLKVRLKEWSIRSDKESYLYFNLILLDMKESCTLQTQLPEEIIEEIRNTVAKEFPKNEWGD